MTQKRLPTAAQLKEMAQIDIHTVEKESLVSAEDVQIHTELSDRERLEDYIRQIKNPYCYLSNGVIVKISFAGRDTLEECLSRCIMSEKKNIKIKKRCGKEPEVMLIWMWVKI